MSYEIGVMGYEFWVMGYELGVGMVIGKRG